MSDDSYLLDSNDKKEKPASRWYGRILKLTFIICAFVLVILTVLANMGGSNEMLKEGVGETISEYFGGRPVKMGRLNNMNFFPTVALDVEDISVYSKPEDVIPLVKLKKFQAYMPFWNVATKTPRMTTLYLEGLEAIRGVFMPASLSAEKIFIDHDMEAGTAKLRGNGKIGVHPWKFEIDLDVSGSKGKYGYMVAQSAPFVFDIADLHFDGTFIRGEENYIKFENFNLVFGDKRLGGDLVASALGKRLLKIKGTLKTAGDQTILSPDLVLNFSDQMRIDVSGSVGSEKILMTDLVGDQSVFSIFSRFREIIGQSAIPRSRDGTLALFGGHDINVDFALKNIDLGGKTMNDLAFNVVQDAGRIKAGPVLSAGEMVMPVVMLLYKQDDAKLISIVQDGRFDTALVGAWLRHLPKSALDRGYVDVSCGIGEFTEQGDNIHIDAFGIDTAAGHIKVKEKTISTDDSFSALHFVEQSGDKELNKVALAKDLYDFAQGSLQKSKEGSPCSSFVFQAKEKTPPPAVEPELVEQDNP